MSNAELNRIWITIGSIQDYLSDLGNRLEGVEKATKPVDQSAGEPVKFEHFMDKVREVFTPDYINAVLAKAGPGLRGAYRLISEVAEFSYRNLLDTTSRQE